MFGLPGVFPELDFLNPVKFNSAFWKPCQNTHTRLVADLKRGVSLKDMQCHMVQMEFGIHTSTYFYEEVATKRIGGLNTSHVTSEQMIASLTRGCCPKTS